MIASLILASLLAPAVGQEITPLDSGRFRVTIVFYGSSAQAHTQAQISIINAARKACRGKGQAVSEGTLEVNNAEPTSTGRKGLSLSEVYRCVPKGS